MCNRSSARAWKYASGKIIIIYWYNTSILLSFLIAQKHSSIDMREMKSRGANTKVQRKSGESFSNLTQTKASNNRRSKWRDVLITIALKFTTDILSNLEPQSIMLMLIQYNMIWFYTLQHYVTVENQIQIDPLRILLYLLYLLSEFLHQATIPINDPERTTAFHIHKGRKTAQIFHVISLSIHRDISSENISKHVYTRLLLNESKRQC